MAGALNSFLDKMRDWKFNPPSNNLWTIKIGLHNDGQSKETKHGLPELYTNILKVNQAYMETFSSSWDIKIDGAEDPLLTYIEQVQAEDIGLFLATDVSFNANAVNIKDESSPNNTQFTGWLGFGKIQNGRQHNHAGKIMFYHSNWDIHELLFDLWIAAIGQQGLIEGDEEDGIYNIKADIIICEYAAATQGKKKAETWQLRKTIKLTKCFPKNRQQYSYTYSSDKAGLFTSDAVDIEFENYSITYPSVAHGLAEAKAAKYEGGAATPIAVNTNTSAGGQAQQTNMYKNATGFA